MTRVLLLSLFVAGACGPSPGHDGSTMARLDGGPGSGGESEFVDAAPEEACEKMDIVFVVDDSGSMVEEQANLAANFPHFVEVLESFTTAAGDALDYRIAVTTTGRDISYTVNFPPIPPIPFAESGANGAFLERDACGMSRPWIERDDADVAGTFGCIAQVGTRGPSIEMPLYAVELAFGDRVADGANAGFLRDDALLALVVLTDEDDCSRTDDDFVISTTDVCAVGSDPLVPIDHFLAALDQLKDVRGRWAAAVIAGRTSCESAFGSAYEAVRLKDFVAAAGATAVFSSICDGDLSVALRDALMTFQSACNSLPPIP